MPGACIHQIIIFTAAAWRLATSASLCCGLLRSSGTLSVGVGAIKACFAGVLVPCWRTGLKCQPLGRAAGMCGGWVRRAAWPHRSRLLSPRAGGAAWPHHCGGAARPHPRSLLREGRRRGERRPRGRRANVPPRGHPGDARPKLDTWGSEKAWPTGDSRSVTRLRGRCC